MGSLSIWHWIIVIAVVLLLFGRGKISDLMGDVAQGIKAFKKGMQDDDKAADEARSRRSPSSTRPRRPRRDPTSAARPSEPEARETRVAAPILRGGIGPVAGSRERKTSCSTSGGVNWS